MGITPSYGGNPSIRADLGREAVAKLFANAGIAPILRLLVAEPEREFSVSELIRLARLSSNEGAKRAVDSLVRAEWIEERRAGRERLVRISPEVLAAPPDPYATVPTAFRGAVRHFVQSLLKESGAEVWKVLLFGGLAVGRGDRLSDIDLLVVTPSPRTVRLRGFRLADELRTSGYQGQRYQVHLLVETPATLRKRSADPQLAGLLRQSIRLWDDPHHPLEKMLPERG